MKKLFVMIAAVIVGLTVSACGETTKTTVPTTTATTATTATPLNFDVADGMYFAAGDEFESGYRYYVVVSVSNGDITNIEWNAYQLDGGAGKCKGESKYACAADGKYGMNNPVDGNMKGHGTWDNQADVAEQWILDNQTLDVTFNESGETDAISTVSVSTNGLFDLIQTALDNGPVAHGDYGKDGYFYLESTKTVGATATYGAEDPSGTALADIATGTYDSYTFGTFVIVNGTLVLADLNATYPLYDFKVDANGTYIKDANNHKIILCDAAGKPLHSYVTKDAATTNYGMGQDTTKHGEWNVQAQLIEAKLVAEQSLDIVVTSGSGAIDGYTDVSFGHTMATFAEILGKLDTATTVVE